LSCCGLTSPAFSQASTVDPDAAEALLRAEFDPAKTALNSDVCVKADGEPLEGDIVRRLRESGIMLAPGDRDDDCRTEVYLGHFSFRPGLGTYEMQFSSQAFGGNNVAVLKHFRDGWHVVATYHIGVWL